MREAARRREHTARHAGNEAATDRFALHGVGRTSGGQRSRRVVGFPPPRAARRGSGESRRALERARERAERGKDEDRRREGWRAVFGTAAAAAAEGAADRWTSGA